MLKKSTFLNQFWGTSSTVGEKNKKRSLCLFKVNNLAKCAILWPAVFAQERSFLLKNSVFLIFGHFKLKFQ